jgi:hypothetical protein
MSAARKTLWFGIRSIYLFGRKKDGTNIFEERIVVFSAKSDKEAFKKAARESREYAKFHKIKKHPLVIAYLQDGDRLIDGYEVWSKLYESKLDLNSFVKEKYDKYEYHPDTWRQIQ